jgi:uracil-DNA glycosylase family 4
MDGREQLRRYLEQRREAGERDLILDGLSVEEVLQLVGSRPDPRRPPRPTGTAPESRADASTTGTDHASADWREVLRNSGASPDAGTINRERREVATSTGDLQLPTGIVVGTDDRELFGGTTAALDSLDAIAKSIASCTRCPLYSTATNPVPGQGNSNADLMIVGEAPGATEDAQGLAFVGAAGQLLTKILAAVELKRDDVFICNVLKHRPPGNRNPMPDEVTACSPYLLRQFELVQPKAILALGTFAAQTLLQTKLSIGKLRSAVHRFYGVPLIVTYHPAALLRNPSWKRPTWEDVQLVRRILDSSASQP